MGITAFPNGVSSFGVPIFPGGFFGQGNCYFVKPYSGSNDDDGKTPQSAFKTLAKALSVATANQNDVVFLIAESNSASATTDYQTTTLDWNKDMVHLVGINSGGPYNKRSRIAWASTAASASDIPLFTLSADGCYIANISMPVGVADANLSFGLNVTGDRNLIENVDVPFPTNATNDAAGAYALKINGCDETEFRRCTFGSFTIDMGSGANQVLLVDSGCSMVKFVDCDFVQRIEHATNSPAVRLADADAVGFGGLWFRRCGFLYTSVSGGYTQGGAFKTTAAQTVGPCIFMDPTCFTNATKWDVDDANMILISGPPTPAADSAGVMRAV